MQTRYLYLLRHTLRIFDLLMINGVYYLSYYLVNHYNKASTQELHYNFIIVCNLLWLFNSTFFGLYSDYSSRRLERIYGRTWKCVVMHATLFTIFLFFSREHGFSRTLLATFYVLLSISFIINRFIGTYVQFLMAKKFGGTQRVAVLGENATAKRLAAYLRNHQHVNFHGFLNFSGGEYIDAEGRVSSKIAEEFQNGLTQQVKLIYVSIDTDKMHQIPLLLEVAEMVGIRLKFIPDLRSSLACPFSLSYLGGEFPVITLRTEPLEEIGARFKKRAFDLLFSFLVFIFLLSWLVPLIAVLIKLDSRGPVFFKQKRAGRDSKTFSVFKFRSMTISASDSEYKQAVKGDARVTRVGAFLRRTSLDELPQFINVVYGNMSIVGPRPHPILLNDQYHTIIEKYMVRHFVKPGITGWAQANGHRGETAEPEQMERRVEHDIWYLENWTLTLDVRIIFMTIINMLRGEGGAY